MNVLHNYINGNVNVKIFDDGSKIREYEGKAQPNYPESIDLKITDYCDAGCSFCHEKSTKLGKHGDLNTLRKVLSPLPPGIEIALGGGNPLSHPGLISFLQDLKQQGLIVNITINQKHLKEYKNLILQLISDQLVYGIGISYTSSSYIPDIIPILKETNNIVFHLIMGINSLKDIQELYELCNSNNKECKVLILGYKYYGYGISYYLKNSNIEKNKYSWYTQLAKYFKRKNLVLSFDNLAIEDLKLKRYFTQSAWEKFFMGNDFTFSMYIDGVLQAFAPSSTSSNRISFSETSMLDYFTNNRNS